MTTALSTPSAPTGFGLMLSPANLEQAQKFAEMLAKSNLVPKAFNDRPGDILIVGAMGARLGIDIFSALAGIASVNGKPTIYGDLMLAVVQNHPAFEDCIETYEGADFPADDFTAVCEVRRKGRAPKVERFSVADAKRASLWGKQGPWTATPKRMLTMRARAFALRGAFADALAGFHAREELDGVELTDVTSTATVHSEPAPARRRRTVDAAAADKSEPSEEPKKADPIKSGLVDEATRNAAINAVEAVAEPKPKKSDPFLDDDTPAPVTKTIDDCLKLANAAFYNAVTQPAVKTITAKWKLNKVQDLGGDSPENVTRFYNELRAAALALDPKAVLP